MSDYWDQSAEAWIADQGERGDFSRAFVLDRAMLERIEGRGFGTALDVGCGEGRFCRMLRDRGIATTGIDPTAGVAAPCARTRSCGRLSRRPRRDARTLPTRASIWSCRI